MSPHFLLISHSAPIAELSNGNVNLTLTLLPTKVSLSTMVTLRRGILERGSAREAIATFYKTRMAGSLPTVTNLHRNMHTLSLLQAPLGGERSAHGVLGTLAAASPTAGLKPAPPHPQLLNCGKVGQLDQLNVGAI